MLFLLLQGLAPTTVTRQRQPARRPIPLIVDDSSASSADLSRWQSLSDAGQRDLDSGDLNASASQLQEALTLGNSLNDGQKRSAATGFDLSALEIIKQFKNSRPNEVDKTVLIPQDYPNHPWETKVNALAQILREKPVSADDEKAIFSLDRRITRG